MATEVTLPRLGQGMESGTIVKWLKSEGDRVEKGEPLYELDTEKVTQEVEAEASGVLLKIAVEEGEVDVAKAEPKPEAKAKAEAEATEVEETQEEEGSAAPAREAERERGREAAAATAAAPTPTGDGRQAETVSPGRIKASPLARRIARERGIDLGQVTGTGPEGRIVAEDVERAAAAPTLAPAPAAAVPAGEVERRELTSIRRTIARRLTEAWKIPVFHLEASADMTRANALVERRRELEPEVRVTVTDLLTKVCATALMRHPEVNAQYSEDAILLFPTANVGIAVAAPQGLIVPVIRSAERLQLAEVTARRADLVSRAREAKLRQEDLEDGTFTISNLGMYRVERFTAVLNPPQAAIIAVGAIEDRVVPVDDGLEVRPMTTFVGTFDHRAVDGAPAAAFLETVKTLLEEPALAL